MNMKSKPAREHARPLARTGNSSAMSRIHALDTSEKITMIRSGISKKELEKVKEQSGLDYDSLSSILSVSRATLINKKGADKFDAATSERILLLADTLAYGQSVF